MGGRALSRERGGRGARASNVECESPLPRTSRWLQRAFQRYARRYLRRHFASLRVDAAVDPAALAGRPVICYLNHPSWWDPMVATVLAHWLLPDHVHHAAIDAAALERYRFFARLGFFGVRDGSAASAREFLRIGAAVARTHDRALWITPEGHFRDAREEPRFEPGLGRLARRLARASSSPDRAPVVFLPIALEYVFWDEKRPEALVRVGAPIASTELETPTDEEMTRRLEASLRETQERLASLARTRDPERFQTLISGRRGIGLLYEGWRAVRDLARGRRPRLGHAVPARGPSSKGAAT